MMKTMNQQIKFQNMTFTISDDRIYMTEFGAFKAEDSDNLGAYRFVEVQLAGEHKNSHEGIKMGGYC